MATLRITFGLDTMEPEARDNFIAAKISKLRHCGAPDISEEKKYLLNAFILNFGLAACLKNESRRIIFNFIRKSEIVFNEYCFGRSALIDYLREPNETVTPYFVSLAHFENCVSHLYQAVLLGNEILHEKQFTTDDGSLFDRLNKMYNQIKYVNSYAGKNVMKNTASFEVFVKQQKNGQIMEREEIGDISTTPIWITNHGLECKITTVSFQELSREILSHCTEAGNMATYDVKKHREQ